MDEAPFLARLLRKRLSRPQSMQRACVFIVASVRATPRMAYEFRESIRFPENITEKQSLFVVLLSSGSVHEIRRAR